MSKTTKKGSPKRKRARKAMSTTTKKGSLKTEIPSGWLVPLAFPCRATPQGGTLENDAPIREPPEPWCVSCRGPPPPPSWSRDLSQPRPVCNGLRQNGTSKPKAKPQKHTPELVFPSSSSDWFGGQSDLEPSRTIFEIPKPVQTTHCFLPHHPPKKKTTTTLARWGIARSSASCPGKGLLGGHLASSQLGWGSSCGRRLSVHRETPDGWPGHPGKWKHGRFKMQRVHILGNQLNLDPYPP